MDQSRRLQGMILPLATKLEAGEAQQIPVDHRKELVQRFGFASVPALEDFRQIADRKGRGPPFRPCLNQFSDFSSIS